MSQIKLMPAIIALLVSIVPKIAKVPKYLHYIWNFVKSIATAPITWVTVSLAPLLSLVFEFFSGRDTPLSGFVTNFVGQIINKILNVAFDIDINDMISQIPANIIEVSCYLGINDALRLLTEGIVSAMVVMLTLRINILVVMLKIRFAKMVKM